LGRAGLDALMRDPRRLDDAHPEHSAVVEMIQRGFDLVFAEPNASSRNRAPVTDPDGPFARSFAKQAKNFGGLDDLPTKAREDLGRRIILDALRGDGFKMPSGFEDDIPPRQTQRRNTETAQARSQSDEAKDPKAPDFPTPPTRPELLGQTDARSGPSSKEWEDIISRLLQREQLFNKADPSMLSDFSRAPRH
jgi:hypothetical protein